MAFPCSMQVAAHATPSRWSEAAYACVEGGLTGKTAAEAVKGSAKAPTHRWAG